MENLLVKKLREIFEEKAGEYKTVPQLIRAYGMGEFDQDQNKVRGLDNYGKTLKLFKAYPIETLEEMQKIEEETGFSIYRDADIMERVNNCIWFIFDYYVETWIDELYDLAIIKSI